MKIAISNICTAFRKEAVGSKVLKEDQAKFMTILDNAIWSYNDSKDLVPGQHFITLPDTANKLVMPGNAPTPQIEEVGDYVLRKYRGQVGKFLKRRSVLRAHQVNVVVYTLKAYMKDPDFTRDELYLKKEKYTHVLVAVLGSFAPIKTTVSYSRFVKNLAGANNEYKVMSKEQLVKLAKDVIAYNDGYSIVAD